MSKFTSAISFVPRSTTFFGLYLVSLWLMSLWVKMFNYAEPSALEPEPGWSAPR